MVGAWKVGIHRESFIVLTHGCGSFCTNLLGWLDEPEPAGSDRMILIGETSLQRVIGESVEHYNRERPHQSLENRIIELKFGEKSIEGEMESDSRLGEMLNDCRKAPQK